MACGVHTAPVGREDCQGKRGPGPALVGGCSKSGGVPGLKGKLEPLSSWSDGEIECTELLKTKLGAQTE